MIEQTTSKSPGGILSTQNQKLIRQINTKSESFKS